jgi:hypothetical protein
VLVTGFFDFTDLAGSDSTCRCRDNPSCRLLLGGETSGESNEFVGELPTRLRAAAPTIEWSFALLPVTWGAARRVDFSAHDVVVSTGLGVYDRDDVLQLEDGAINLRGRRADASGRRDPGRIARRSARVFRPHGEALRTRMCALAGRRFGSYTCTIRVARAANAYLCNETHYLALSALERCRRDVGRLRAVFFVHLPRPRANDYALLGVGVASLVRTLVDVAEG